MYRGAPICAGTDLVVVHKRDYLGTRNGGSGSKVRFPPPEDPGRITGGYQRVPLGNLLTIKYWPAFAFLLLHAGIPWPQEYHQVRLTGFPKGDQGFLPRSDAFSFSPTPSILIGGRASGPLAGSPPRVVPELSPGGNQGSRGGAGWGFIPVGLLRPRLLEAGSRSGLREFARGQISFGESFPG